MDRIGQILAQVSPKPVQVVIVQALVIYFVLLLAVRLTGKRGIGHASPLDFIIALAVGDVIDEIAYGTESLVNALAIVGIWIVLHNSIAFVENRWQRFEDVVEGKRRVVLENGRFDKVALKKERVSEEEIMQLLRNLSIDDVSRLKKVLLETDGSISAFPAEVGR